MSDPAAENATEAAGERDRERLAALLDVDDPAALAEAERLVA